MDAPGSADFANARTAGLTDADPSDRQEFNVYSRVIQGKQETEATTLTTSWLQVKPGGTH